MGKGQLQAITPDHLSQTVGLDRRRQQWCPTLSNRERKPSCYMSSSQDYSKRLRASHRPRGRTGSEGWLVLAFITWSMCSKKDMFSWPKQCMRVQRKETVCFVWHPREGPARLVHSPSGILRAWPLEVRFQGARFFAEQARWMMLKRCQERCKPYLVSKMPAPTLLPAEDARVIRLDYLVREHVSIHLKGYLMTCTCFGA